MGWCRFLHHRAPPCRWSGAHAPQVTATAGAAQGGWAGLGTPGWAGARCRASLHAVARGHHGARSCSLQRQQRRRRDAGREGGGGAGTPALSSTRGRGRGGVQRSLPSMSHRALTASRLQAVHRQIINCSLQRRQRRRRDAGREGGGGASPPALYSTRGRGRGGVQRSLRDMSQRALTASRAQAARSAPPDYQLQSAAAAAAAA